MYCIHRTDTSLQVESGFLVLSTYIAVVFSSACPMQYIKVFSKDILPTAIPLNVSTHEHPCKQILGISLVACGSFKPVDIT